MPRGSFHGDPKLLDGVIDLLDVVFTGREALAQAARLGLRIEDESTPFVIHEDGRVVSHVGVLSLPLVVDGQQVAAAGIHGVCTHPDCRGNGLYRRVMAEAMAWCHERFETVLLFTDHPALYEPFGFRVIPEHGFVVRDVGDLKQRGTSALRRLDWARDEDIALLKRIARERIPVSQVLGVAPAPGLFAFNATHLPMWYSSEFDTLLAMQTEGGIVRICDVAAGEMPRWEELIRLIPANAERVELCFSPDLLDVGESVVSGACPFPGYLMACGPLGDETRPRMLPRTAEF